MYLNKPRWQVKTKTIVGVVSTVELPIVFDNEVFETCIFFKDGESEVVDRYTNKVSAAKGHARHVIEYGGEQSVASCLLEILETN